MNLKTTIGIVGMMGMLAAGCGNYDYKKTSDGLMYKVIADGKGDKIKPGQFLKVYISNSINDSVLSTNFGRIPAYGQYDTTAKNNYNFIDFLGEMKVGDSAIFLQSIDTLQKRGMIQYNKTFKQGGSIKGAIKIVKVFATEAEVNADYLAEIENEKKREVVALEQYLKEKKVTNAVKTTNGVFVVMEKEGTGPVADSGTQVKVNYTGYLKNGEKFDSNLDSSFQHVTPYEFVVGARTVIPGWDEAVQLFKEGGKGKLYVPAMLAYGQQPRGEKMPAFSDLIFDFELIEVKPAAEASAVPPMNQP